LHETERSGENKVSATLHENLIICADDYGMSQEINDAVLELVRLGRLNATSCLVDGPAFEHGAPALKHSGAQAGLHLNFTEKLRAHDGIYEPVGRLIRACWLRQLDPDTVRSQIERQLRRYLDVMGRLPDFIDGHQHVHQFPVIRSALFQVLQQHYTHTLPWLRCTLPGRLAGVPLQQRVKAHVIYALGGRAFARLAKQRGFAVNTGFYGVYDFTGGHANYRNLLRAWVLDAGPGDVLMCHPAVQPVPADPLGRQRVAEFEVLRSEPAPSGFNPGGAV
jgi:predicted glycoside hydrolase/deacetylase ChbG (UPF0249 family)